MERVEVKVSFEQYDSPDELQQEDRVLLDKAREACKSAYAPYSHFFVGAAVLLENGKIITGSNQENAAYPSGLCAERVALFSASSQYPEIKIKKIAVAAFPEGSSKAHPVSPCGDCRQVMAEYEHRYGTDIRLIMVGDGGKILVSDNVKTILPFMFNSDNLK
jgi:cytidine deaminase